LRASREGVKSRYWHYTYLDAECPILQGQGTQSNT
jgi:hypothetical protein